jgi:hypothetical protein
VNILFVNYGGETSNSLNHIRGFAHTALLNGYDCTIALPQTSSPAHPSRVDSLKVASYAKLLCSRSPFPKGEPADIIHAWTPRECVRTFVTAYRHQAPLARLIIHLEDNEGILLQTYSGKSIAELDSLPPKALRKLISPQLSHPLRYREFLKQASGITYITERLEEFCPSTSLTHLLYPGIAAYTFDTSEDAKLKRLALAIKRRPNEKLIVYTGSTTFANVEDIRILLTAVQLLNERGTPSKLVRTGINPPALAAELAPLARDHVID